MGAGFEVTVEDIQAVLAMEGRPASYGEAEAILAEHVGAAAGRVEKAALRGDDLDEQTGYAYEEIADVLREAGIIGGRR